MNDEKSKFGDPDLLTMVADTGVCSHKHSLHTSACYKHHTDTSSINSMRILIFKVIQNTIKPLKLQYSQTTFNQNSRNWEKSLNMGCFEFEIQYDSGH